MKQNEIKYNSVLEPIKERQSQTDSFKVESNRRELQYTYIHRMHDGKIKKR